MSENHELLKKLVYKGASEKELDLSDTVLDRIGYELSVIENREFTDYFILYARIIEVCNELRLIRTCGRGSAANSLVNYSLDITKINPLNENLVFERFVHPQQKQLPDIDIDIPNGYQKKVIENLKLKYPEYNTYFIAYIPKIEADYKNVIYNETVYKKHPCGIIITPKKLTTSIFLYEEDEYYLADNSISDPIFDNKFDILELEYLNRLQLIVNEIGEKYNPYKLPLCDKKVFDLFVSGDLENIFQSNSSSLKQIFREFKPNSIHDLSLINAMFRPGILEFIPTVIRNKYDYEKLIFPSDIRVSEILKETYGILIYQETFLLLCNHIAGISFSDAEAWRKKIMRNKSNEDVIIFSNLFSKGCREHSSLIDDEIAILADLVTRMQPRTFQKAHSLSYSMVSYWGAYYKAHFRSVFDKVFSEEVNFQQFEL